MPIDQLSAWLPEQWKMRCAASPSASNATKTTFTHVLQVMLTQFDRFGKTSAQHISIAFVCFGE
jgi:hypothetical protein